MPLKQITSLTRHYMHADRLTRKDNKDMTQDFTLSLADRITNSRSTDGINHAFKRVLRAVYNQPYIDIPPKLSKAYMGFCDALTGIKKALANRQEIPPKLTLLPIECQNPPYCLVDYRINGSEKNSGVCVIFENFKQSA